MKVDGKQAFFDKYSALILIISAFLIAVFFVGFASYFSLENTQFYVTEPVTFAEGWHAETEAGYVELDEASRSAAGVPDGTLVLVNTLPPMLSERMSLCFQTKNETVRVFVDDELIYSYGEKPQLIYGHGVGAIYNLFELPANAAGKTVSIELTPVDTRTGLAPYTFLLGGHNDIIVYLLRSRVPLIAVSALLALIGLISLGLAMAYVIKHARSAGSVFWFALFSLLAAVWTAADSGLLQFVLNSKGVAYMLFGCSFYLLCSPFALFMASVDPGHSRLFRIISMINSVYALLRIILYETGVLDFETGLWTLHVFMGIMIVATNLMLWLPILLQKKRDGIWLCLAVSAFTLVASVSLVSFYAGNKLNVQRNGYASGFYWGILLFAVITVIGAIRKALRIREQAFKADFYKTRAYTDDLTGLLNVKGFDDKCTELLRSAPAGECLALVDFDVNFFSQYNANKGLEAGDALLVRIANTLKESCSAGELCARQEADHFVCLLRGSSLESIISRIHTADETHRTVLSTRRLLLSYGVAPVTERSVSTAALRNQAVVSKRTVKGNYENNIAVYDHALHQKQINEMELFAGLESALEHDEYVIFLQPKIYVAGEHIGGAEALVRHIMPDGSVVSAGAIIDALERNGFIAKLDYYVLELVCAFLRRCLDCGRRVCPISSNFSRAHLYEPDFPERVAQTVDRYRLPHELVEIEITETAFLAGKDALKDAVCGLHTFGFSVAVDDFGSGYSSLNMLKDVDVDVVKLDREFLEDFAENRRARTVIEHTLRLACEMGITTVAEGIETEDQLLFLRGTGCNLVQGFYYSAPLPESDFISRYLSADSNKDGQCNEA